MKFLVPSVHSKNLFRIVTDLQSGLVGPNTPRFIYTSSISHVNHFNTSSFSRTAKPSVSMHCCSDGVLSVVLHAQGCLVYRMQTRPHPRERRTMPSAQLLGRDTRLAKAQVNRCKRSFGNLIRRPSLVELSTDEMFRPAFFFSVAPTNDVV